MEETVVLADGKRYRVVSREFIPERPLLELTGADIVKLHREGKDVPMGGGYYVTKVAPL